MRQLRISHTTHYQYREPVSFGPHRAMMRPREGHDVRILAGKTEVSPDAEVQWLRDIYGNAVAALTFPAPARELRVHGEIDLLMRDSQPAAHFLTESAKWFPFHYPADELLPILPFRVPSYPHDASTVLDWLASLHKPGTPVETFDLLMALNTHIFSSLRYEARDDPGVQLPCRTLELGSGSCRDYAALMMEAARHWGMAARFVTGYILIGEGQHGATHAWTEIYLPGMGWCGFDPTNNKLASSEHVPVAVARDQENASPLSGTWSGPADAFESLDVRVEVSEMTESSRTNHTGL